MNARLLALAAAVAVALAAWFALSNPDVDREASGDVTRDSPTADVLDAPEAEDLAEVDQPQGESRQDQASQGVAPAAVSEAESPPEIEALATGPAAPPGTAVRGRLLDKEGSAIRRAHLRLRVKGQREGLPIRADDAGRFSVAVGVFGDAQLFVRADGVGRSADLSVYLPEGQETDVGDLRVLSAGAIRGHVRFPDGTPLSGVEVSGSAVDSLASPGLRSGSAETGDDGSFEILALAPGPFDFTVSKFEALAILGNKRLQTGDENGELVVNAMILELFCQNEDGESVPMVGLSISNLPDPAEDDDEYGTNTFRFGGPQERYEVILHPWRRYIVEAKDEDNRNYLAYLQGDLTAGKHTLPLRRDPPELGTLRVTFPPGAIPEGATLSLASIERDGLNVSGMSSALPGRDGDSILEARGLVPGSYRVRFQLENADWAALKEDTHTVEISPGGTEVIALEPRIGGRAEFSIVVANVPADGPPKTRAKVQLRWAGEAEWDWAELVSKREGTTTRGGRAWLDGTVARSSVLTPGNYQARVTASGYAPVEIDFAVPAEGATEILVTLRDQ